MTRRRSDNNRPFQLPNDSSVSDFRATVWRYYAAHGRDMPWRRDHGPYRVVVSELMLQQTQVGRVTPKFISFIESFPNVESLAKAPLGEVLRAWNGLGYNRRAQYLHQTARHIISRFGGMVPQQRSQLITLPGIGDNTAGAILAYAFNQPVIFIETNIRSVLLWHFFADRTAVSEGELLAVASVVMDLSSPREWYWALMDYGSFLKKAYGGQLGRSTAYRQQAPLKGSNREMRGWLLRWLVERPWSWSELRQRWPDDERLGAAVGALENEGLIRRDGELVCLT